eukprot:TRINITY_DN8669_c0_g1_i4.p2 TRINITY_DN8669_c0_g1~~TRINITY_DN8669_c0_g1_i4.p2  ORF type:complete len:144 (-),score=39.60 TRINITY_DN8669_c0_g1_i4:565-996(-)
MADQKPSVDQTGRKNSEPQVEASVVEKKDEETQAGGEEEDQEECGFCRWMKAGGCKVEFMAWEECVDKARKENEDFTTDCHQKTTMLHSCMEQHRDYYLPLLEEEEELARERKEKETENQKKEEGSGVESSAQGQGSSSEAKS